MECFSGLIWYWWCNGGGIILEIVGALFLVVAAFRGRNRIKGIQDTWDADLAGRLRDVSAGQAYGESMGFVFLAIGLGRQLVATLE